MKEIRKKMIAFLTVLVFGYLCLPFGSFTMEVKADEPQPATDYYDITLPKDEEQFLSLIESNPDIKFGTVTIDIDGDAEITYILKHSFRAEKLITKEQRKLKIEANEENGTIIPTIVDVDDADLDDNVYITKIENSTDAGVNEFRIRNKLMIRENGGIVAYGNGYLNLEYGGSPREIYTPALSFIVSDGEVRILKGSKIITTTDNRYLEYVVDMGALSQYEVKFDGVDNKDDDYIFILKERERMIKDGGPGISKTVTLPSENDIFEHTIYRYNWINRNKETYPSITFNSITVKDNNFETDRNISVEKLSVAQGSNFTLKCWTDKNDTSNTDDSSIVLVEEATISGTLTVKGDGENKTGSFEIANDAVLKIPEGGNVVTNGTGRIIARAGSKILTGADSTPLTVKIGDGYCSFDGNLEFDVYLQCVDGEWTGEIPSNVVYIAGINIADKIHDGNTEAEIVGTPVIKRVSDDETVDGLVVSNITATFADSNVGKNKPVVVTKAILKDSGNYILSIIKTNEKLKLTASISEKSAEEPTGTSKESEPATVKEDSVTIKEKESTTVTEKTSKQEETTIPATVIKPEGTTIVNANTKIEMVVTSKAGEEPTVAFAKIADTEKSVEVPETITDNGVIYKVTSIVDGAFKGKKKLEKVTLSKNITKIPAGTFKGCKALKTITIKSSKLTKKAVKGALKGSKVKTIKVKVGSKKQNKEIIKKYKKIFTKKNAGRKVTVK